MIAEMEHSWRILLLINVIWYIRHRPGYRDLSILGDALLAQTRQQ